jgi:hypothetical protein
LSLSKTLVPSSGCLLGIYPGSSCDSATSDYQRLLNHETQVNRTVATNGLVNVVSAYHDWNDFTTSFAAPTGGEGKMVADGRILLIHWTPRIFNTSTQFRWPDIAAGVYDSQYVDPTARAMAAFGQPAFLAFHNEMNASSSAQSGTYGTDAEYASAARHVHDRFVAQGATNVIWVFKPSGYTTTISRMNTLYPGDAYVDWIMWDPYGKNGEDFDYVMSTKYPMYQWATVTKSGSHTKPLGFGEWGAFEAAGPTTKAAYIAQVQSQLAASWPLVKLICWFNSTSNGECINTSAAALTAYKALAKDPYFRPDLSATPPPVGAGLFQVGASKGFNNSAHQTLVIPSGVQAGWGMALFHGCTRAGLKNAAEGTNGAALTVANSAAAGSNPVDAVAGTPPTFDTTSPLDGNSSWHCAVTAGTTSGGRWNTSFAWPGAGGSYKGSLLYRYPSNPSAVCRIYQQAPASGNPQWGIGIETNGKISIRDLAAGVSRGTQVGTAPATATKHRIDFEAAWDGGLTTVTLKLFLGTNWNGTTPDETITSPPFTQAAAPGAGTFGVHFTAANTYDLHVDQARLFGDAWPGPPRTSPVLTPPAGWTEIIPTGTKQIAAGAGELSTRGFRRTAVAGDAGSTITLDTTDGAGNPVNAHGSIMLVCYAGVDQLALVDVAAATTASADSATTTSPNATTLVPGDVIVSVFFDRANPPAAATATWTPPLIGAGPDREAVRVSSFGSGTDGRVAGAVTDDGATHAIGTYGTKAAVADQTSYLHAAWTLGLLSAAAAAGTGQGIGDLHTVN